jgi:hypothetical protein
MLGPSDTIAKSIKWYNCFEEQSVSSSKGHHMNQQCHMGVNSVIHNNQKGWKQPKCPLEMGE